MKKTLKQLLNRKPAQTVVKGRSPALIITIAIHAILLLIAGTFVAVTVVQRSETKFEGKQIVHPKMKLKKLQVPVKIEQQVKRQTPSLSQRVTANTRINTKSTDFKMPEVAGFGTGSGVDLSGAALGGSLGFASTQINVFGLKSSGEKILFVLDTNRNMLIDEIGGIPAYKIIKDELTSLISRLPPTALFNVVVFDNTQARSFSKELSTASPDNIEKLKQWLAPLNSDKARFGLATLPSPGTTLAYEPIAPIANIQRGWPAAFSYAVKTGVDNIYWLGTDDYLNWIHRDLYNDVKRGKPLLHPSGWPPESQGIDYSPAGGKEKWDKLVAEARKKFEAENARRSAAGQPLRVIPGFGGEAALVGMYFEGAAVPRRVGSDNIYQYTADDVVEYIEALQKKYAGSDRRSAGIGLQTKPLSVNVIHFVPKSVDARALVRLDAVARKMNGSYLRIEGLEAIRSSATAR
jgi:hypothetical protein